MVNRAMFAAIVGLACVASAVAAEPTVSLESLLSEMVDRDALPRLPSPAHVCKQASSYDRKQTDPRNAKTWFANSVVEVNGIPLHYLDWGGSGPILLFLPGMGCNAHIFDDLTPRFVDKFHVMALTRC